MRYHIFRARIVDRCQAAWNRFTGAPHCFRIGLVELLIMLAVVSLSLGITCLIIGAFGIRYGGTVCVTIMGVHRIVIPVAMMATIRWPGRRMVAFYLANAILHFLLASTCITVDSISLVGPELLPSYKNSFHPCTVNALSTEVSSANSKKAMIRVLLTILSCYTESISLVLSLLGLVTGLRLRRYIIAKQRYDLARASREEIGRVFAVENRAPLPWPPFRHRMPGQVKTATASTRTTSPKVPKCVM